MRPAQHPQHRLESTHAGGGVRSLIGRRRRRALAAAGLLFALLAVVAPWMVFSAATINAESPAQGFFCGGNWSTASNWDLGRAPISGDDVVFGVNPPNATDSTNYDLAVSVQLNSLTVANKLAGCSGNFIVTGGSIGLQSGAGPATLPGITLNWA